MKIIPYFSHHAREYRIIKNYPVPKEIIAYPDCAYKKKHVVSKRAKILTYSTEKAFKKQLY